MQATQLSFNRVAIVNRGEPAMRLIHAVREINNETGHGLRTVALYTEPDRNSMFVREADEAICLGPAMFQDPTDGRRKSSYLDYSRLEAALRAGRCDAAWVGWGFVAEHAAFADLCQSLGLTFIGPSGDVMRALGDKIAAKLLAEQTKVPVAAWSGGPVASPAEAAEAAERIGYPLLIKASAGGGGRGIRKVCDLSELEAAFESARSEAAGAFGDATVFLEKLVTAARHVEVQVLGDAAGNAWAVGVRDCTLQRRHQKVLEEAPSPVVRPEVEAELRAAAARFTQAAGYQNAGTMEFLFDPSDESIFFMEMNTRLQVEHPVTELTTGLDLVKCQLYLASGALLEGEPPPTVGHAIEVRLNAEDPDNDYAPAPGEIVLMRLPSGPGLRIDTGVAEGDQLPADFDSMIAKIIAFGASRDEALARLRRALQGMSVLIRGGRTNKPFLLELVSRDEIRRSEIDTEWLGRTGGISNPCERPYADVALAVAAIEIAERRQQREKQSFITSALRSRPEVERELGREVALKHGGHEYAFEVFCVGEGHYRLAIDGGQLDVSVTRHSEHEMRVSCLGQLHHVISSFETAGHLIEVDGILHVVSNDEGGAVRAPSPGIVLSVAVEVGDELAVGDRVAVMEAMKMETVLTAPFAGRVREVLTRPGLQAAAGEPLLLVDREQGVVSAPEGPRIELARPAGSDEETADQENASTVASTVADSPGGADSVGSRAERSLAELRQLMLGFELPALEIEQAAAWWSALESLPDEAGTARVIAGLDEVLSIFTDIVWMFSPHPCGSGQPGPSCAELLRTFLCAIGTGGAGLPEEFATLLRRALGHFGELEDLDRSPELDEAVFRIHRSYRTVDRKITLVLALLEARFRLEPRLDPAAGEAARDLLNRLAQACDSHLEVIAEMARGLRYRHFELPAMERAQLRSLERISVRLSALLRTSDEEQRRQQITALVNTPLPIEVLLVNRLFGAGTDRQVVILETLIRRLYRVEEERTVRMVDESGLPFGITELTSGGRRHCVLSCLVPLSDLDEALAVVSRYVASRFKEHAEAVKADNLVIVWDGPTDDGDAIAAELERRLQEAPFEILPERLAFAILEPEHKRLANYLTFVHDGTRFVEYAPYRNIHPAQADYLEVWRLERLELERVPRPDEPLLVFRAVARDNPSDERIVIHAEVHDLTAVWDRSHQVARLPELELLCHQALDVLRSHYRSRPERLNLDCNLLLLFLRPTAVTNEHELMEVLPDFFRRLAPSTRNLGIDRIMVHMPPTEDGGGTGPRQVMTFSLLRGSVVGHKIDEADRAPIAALTAGDQNRLKMRRRGLIDPYDIVSMLAPSESNLQTVLPRGAFQEHDLDEHGSLVPVDRPFGENRANVIVGEITSFTAKHPEGMKRVIILGDPSRGLGSLAEPECSRIILALDLAEHLSVPVEWFAVSSGARIAMNSGTENLDWTARVLRRIIELTQAGGEVNIIVDAVNVGAQSYWNAEATMLMHTRGILIMTESGSMVLTGKRALEFSGGVSAEDNKGIGGVDRIMGPNGQAQYKVPDVAEACQILMRHYEHTYVAPGERFPRLARSSDPVDRDITSSLAANGTGNGGLGSGSGNESLFTTVGEIFDNATNPGRKKPFWIRPVMRATIDQDHPPLERWAMMTDAETAVIWEAHLGGNPVCLIGIESSPIARLGYIPGDGPDSWSGGTLYPISSKKVARAINAASNNRPVVILANLSGFDGSPESMLKLQLEYGAEIGRAVVNFKGPMIFCVISRYHGGAYVVFSRALNENLETAALVGSYASVIGGAPAAAVVFPREVKKRTLADPRIVEARARLDRAEVGQKATLGAAYDELYRNVHADKLAELAAEFEAIHTIERAREVGSIDTIIGPVGLRPYLIEAVERGMLRITGQEPDQ